MDENVGDLAALREMAAREAESGRDRLFAARHAEPLTITEVMADSIFRLLRRYGLVDSDEAWLDSLRNSLLTRGADQGLRLGAFSGVKFWTEGTGRGWRVNCYPEERTTALAASLSAANFELASLERKMTFIAALQADMNEGGEQ